MNTKDFKAALKDEISESNLPVRLGGSFEPYNEPLVFDLSPTSGIYFDYSSVFASGSVGASEGLPVAAWAAEELGEDGRMDSSEKDDAPIAAAAST